MARFVELLGTENADLDVYDMHPGVIHSELYNKLELPLGEILDDSR